MSDVKETKERKGRRKRGKRKGETIGRKGKKIFTHTSPTSLLSGCLSANLCSQRTTFMKQRLSYLADNTNTTVLRYLLPAGSDRSLF